MARIATLAAALAAVAGAWGAAPAHAGNPGCPPAAAAPDRLSWVLRIAPGDDLMTAWCRLQALPGAVRLNVNFPVAGANRSWETSLAGRDLPAHRIVELVQSLLPVADGPAKDDKGMPFPRVLNSVVQAGAAETPNDGRPLGFPKGHPAAGELILWEPVDIRVKPVALAGQEFTLVVSLRPNLGMFALAMQGRATDVRFRAWKGRMPRGGFMSDGCADAIPDCKGLPEAPVVHAPWLVTRVSLVATGDNMSAAASRVMSQLAANNHAFLASTPSFDVATGAGSLEAKDTVSKLVMKAEGSPSGTKAISIEWSASTGKGTLAEALDRALVEYRSATTGRPAKAPTVPDSLGNL